MLPLLTSHLTFKAIAARFHLSPHTVKSHAMSIYRKLDVTSRERGRRTGTGDRSALTRGSIIPSARCGSGPDAV